MRKIATIVGARPQFIKASVVSRAASQHGNLEEVLIHTGQHYDANMSAIFFEEMMIPPPRYNLGVAGGSHGAMTGRQIEQIEQVLITEKPALVIVYGDTNSTLAGALAAVKLNLPVAHVEAGLRSFNRRMPEEINRVVADHVASLLFTPTSTASENLRREGIDPALTHLVGDVMYDVALFYRQRARKPAWFDNLGVSDYVLCTIHRQENTDNEKRLTAIVDGLESSQQEVILPLHPRTLSRFRASRRTLARTVHLVEPVGYLEMFWLEMHCSCVATDSGGVQKEAYFHGKPCVTLRSETEWIELVEHGYNQLVGTNPTDIAEAVAKFRPDIGSAPLYGCGDASVQVVGRIAEYLAD